MTGFTPEQRAEMEAASQKRQAPPGKFRVLLTDTFEPFPGGPAVLGDFSREEAIALAERRTNPKAMTKCFVYDATGKCVWPPEEP